MLRVCDENGGPCREEATRFGAAIYERRLFAFKPEPAGYVRRELPGDIRQVTIRQAQLVVEIEQIIESLL